MPRKVGIFGATGSIGKTTLSLLDTHQGDYDVEVLTTNQNVELLAQQALKFKPNHVAVVDESKYEQLKSLLAGTNVQVHAGYDALSELAKLPFEWGVSAIVGAAALKPTLTMIEQGKTIALANKECLVCAGNLMLEKVKKHNATLIPVDSEHSAIFQLFDMKQHNTVSRIILTASGGPFKDTPIENLQRVTVEQAVNHPNWSMGKKISIDSATMMNKSLEMIEAFHLFPVTKDQIEVIIHPKSIIHSFVEYIDGSLLAHMSAPDMSVPISYALGYPNRIHTPISPLDLVKLGKLEFEPACDKRFRSLKLVRDVMGESQYASIIFNVANEVAVEAFIQGKIRFIDIVNLVECMLQRLPTPTIASIDDVLDAIHAIEVQTTEFLPEFSKNRAA